MENPRHNPVARALHKIMQEEVKIMSFEEKAKAYLDSLTDDEKEKLFRIHGLLIEHGVVAPILELAMDS